MDGKLVVFALFMLLICSPAYAVSAEAIEWRRDFSAARELAKRTGKPMLIDFVADWCAPCKEMAKRFWSEPQIIALSKKFVCVSLDLDQRGAEVSRYRIDRIPAVVFADSWGNVLTIRFGFGAETFGELSRVMQAIPADFSPINEWNAVLETETNNAAALVGIGDFYREKGAPDLSNEYFKRALKTKELETNLKVRESVLLAVGVNYLNQKDYDKARKSFEACLKEIPNGAQGDKALLGIITAQLNKKKIGEAEKTLAQLKASHPDSPVVQQAEHLLQQARSYKK